MLKFAWNWRIKDLPDDHCKLWRNLRCGKGRPPSEYFTGSPIALWEIISPRYRIIGQNHHKWLHRIFDVKSCSIVTENNIKQFQSTERCNSKWTRRNNQYLPFNTENRSRIDLNICLTSWIEVVSFKWKTSQINWTRNSLVLCTTTQVQKDDNDWNSLLQYLLRIYWVTIEKKWHFVKYA